MGGWRYLSDISTVHQLKHVRLREVQLSARNSHTVEVQDNEQTRGMLHRVRHLVKIDG